MADDWASWAVNDVRLDWGVFRDDYATIERQPCYRAVLLLLNEGAYEPDDWGADGLTYPEWLAAAARHAHNQHLDLLRDLAPVHEVLVGVDALLAGADPAARDELSGLVERDDPNDRGYPPRACAARLREELVRAARSRVRHPLDLSRDPSEWWSVQETGSSIDMGFFGHWAAVRVSPGGGNYVLRFDVGAVLTDEEYEQLERALADLPGSGLPLKERGSLEVAVPRCGFRAEYGRAMRRAHPFDARHLTPDVIALAQQAAASNNPTLLPILADALEDAGCSDGELLEHCRFGGPHSHRC